MDKNSLNTNKQFMIGNGMLAFGVFAVIIIFLYMSFRFQRKADKVQTYEGVYNIELTNSFAGDSIAVYLNEQSAAGPNHARRQPESGNKALCRR